MIKYNFFNDYSETAHPLILENLAKDSLIQEPGYGDDSVSLAVSSRLQDIIKSPDAAIHLVSGGTQANLICIESILRPFESIIAASTGHILVHEAGSIEATGHKINLIPTKNGKITVEQIQAVLDEHDSHHMVSPAAVYVTNSTEIGTIYTKQELQDISQFCRSCGLYLYLDGARLGSALTSSGNDLTLEDIANLVDMFYIGGTKNGALFGEAIIITNPKLQPNFTHYLKRRGALLAKGRVLGSQFLTLFQDNLFFELAHHANDMADILRCGLKESGFEFFSESTTNQIFPILPNSLISKLHTDYGFYDWQKIDNQFTAIRLVTSWATPESAISSFLSDVKKYQSN